MDLFLLTLGGYPLYKMQGIPGLVGGLVALVLTTVNVLVGYYYIELYFDAEFQVFMRKVFGSMGLRLMALAAFIFMILKFAPIDKIGFIITLFVSYISKSVQEMILLQSKTKKKSV
ncbi:hypothetical protein EP331_04385 [bacterium]|nr:MAG: hypothetical protein EP331_04385 [bacterium]